MNFIKLSGFFVSPVCVFVLSKAVAQQTELSCIDQQSIMIEGFCLEGNSKDDYVHPRRTCYTVVELEAMDGEPGGTDAQIAKRLREIRKNALGDILWAQVLESESCNPSR